MKQRFLRNEMQDFRDDVIRSFKTQDDINVEAKRLIDQLGKQIKDLRTASILIFVWVICLTVAWVYFTFMFNKY